MTGIFGRGHTGTTAPAMPPQAPVPAPPVADEVPSEPWRRFHMNCPYWWAKLW